MLIVAALVAWPRRTLAHYGALGAAAARAFAQLWKKLNALPPAPAGAGLPHAGEHPSSEDVRMPDAPIAGDFASRIVAAMAARNYPLAVGPDVLNIVYVEGADAPDGKPNANRPNAFDSLRILIRVLPDMRTGVNALLPDGSAEILGMWDAITHAGMYWEMHRMNPAGAFHIALGQQACWIMGHYHDMEALIQAAPIAGTRDASNNFKREGPTVRGDFGVHHHWGYNYPKDDAGLSSAGCQVGRTEAGHNQFIALLKTDARYQANRGFLWPSTVMPGEWLAWPPPNPNYPSRGI